MMQGGVIIVMIALINPLINEKGTALFLNERIEVNAYSVFDVCFNSRRSLNRARASWKET